MGGIKGYEKGTNSGYDIKAKNNSLFAEVKNKHNTVNSKSAEAAYQELIRFAKKYPKAKCYFVIMIAKKSMCKRWKATFKKRIYSHPRVYICSADKFYKILTGRENAFKELCDILPLATKQFLKSKKMKPCIKSNSKIIKEFSANAIKNKRNTLSEIFNLNFKDYSGF